MFSEISDERPHLIKALSTRVSHLQTGATQNPRKQICSDPNLPKRLLLERHKSQDQYTDQPQMKPPTEDALHTLINTGNNQQENIQTVVQEHLCTKLMMETNQRGQQEANTSTSALSNILPNQIHSLRVQTPFFMPQSVSQTCLSSQRHRRKEALAKVSARKKPVAFVNTTRSLQSCSPQITSVFPLFAN